MDEQDKIYLWMIIATFAALVIGILFGILHQNDLFSTIVNNVTII